MPIMLEERTERTEITKLLICLILAFMFYLALTFSKQNLDKMKRKE